LGLLLILVLTFKAYVITGNELLFDDFTSEDNFESSSYSDVDYKTTDDESTISYFETSSDHANTSTTISTTTFVESSTTTREECKLSFKLLFHKEYISMLLTNFRLF
jgi:hypothetical protein